MQHTTLTTPMRIVTMGILLSASSVQALISFDFVQTASGVTVTASGETPSWFSSSFPIQFAEQAIFGNNGEGTILSSTTNGANYMGSSTFASISGDIPWGDASVSSTNSVSGSTLAVLIGEGSGNVTIFSDVATGSTTMGGSTSYFTNGETLADFGFTPPDIALGAGTFSLLDASSNTLVEVNWTTGVVPEPSTYTMIFAGLVGVAAFLKRRKR
ncbi:hypothetical protein GCM10007047_26340 [Cerasicoccus arenae]|uniref:Ice-binding protein C-terminal domain-containing protein n=2 Tax=Cerasicoccus arenae TaxID=424488 RepID=A0A8J3DLJ6_9BACT|nr:hypothetical protein GCM10007047_26340 [Cerasicoccus arenae]